MSAFMDLRERWRQSDTLLCVGLDPDEARIPAHLGRGEAAIFTFCRDIVDATAEFVCAFKPQIAYFASLRAEGALEEIIGHIHARHPGIPVILDAKRGDIGSTAEHYAREAFERYRADAVTLSPYMGRDSVEPFLAYEDKAAFLLCRTSNPGGGELQSLDVGGERLFERIARLALEWSPRAQLGLVVGATFPRELAEVRALAPELPLLVPGIGAQGGDVTATVRAGGTTSGDGLVINSSRAILYAGDDSSFAAAAARAARSTREEINEARRAL